MVKRVLVTGANGFTGSYLCRRLVQRGDHVRALVRPTVKLTALEGLDVELIRGDLADPSLPAGILQGIDVVYNVAAVYRKDGVPEQYFFRVNADGAERLLRAALQAGVRRFVHLSTVGVLGDVRTVPASEASPYNPSDYYQRSKAEGERRALAFFAERGLPGVVIRPTAIYGPGDTRFLKLFRGIDKGLFWMLGSGEVFYHLIYVLDSVRKLTHLSG